jgi:hypothetical protein
MLSKQILRSVGTEDAKLDAALYEEMLASESQSRLLEKTPNARPCAHEPDVQGVCNGGWDQD